LFIKVFACFCFSLAISDYKNAEKLLHEGSNSRRVKDGLNKAQKLLKQSQKRDYYKILGVKRYLMILCSDYIISDIVYL